MKIATIYYDGDVDFLEVNKALRETFDYFHCTYSSDYSDGWIPVPSTEFYECPRCSHKIHSKTGLNLPNFCENCGKPNIS